MAVAQAVSLQRGSAVSHSGSLTLGSQVLTLILDWLRIYMLAILLPTNWFVVLGITVFFMSIAYTLLFLFRTVVLRNRPDMRAEFPMKVFLMYPLYKVMSTFLFRQYALVENAVYYSINFKRHTIANRLRWAQDPRLCAEAKQQLGEEGAKRLMECATSDFPPRPNRPDPDWWHVWTPQNLEALQLSQSGETYCKAVPKCVLAQIRQLCSAEYHQSDATTLKSVHPSDQGRLEPMVLALVLLMQLGVESSYSCFRESVIEACSTNWCVNHFNAESLGDLILGFELAPYDVIGERDPILDHNVYDIEWYRSRVNEFILMWGEACERTQAEGLQPDDPGYAAHLFMTDQIFSMTDQPGGEFWEEELVDGLIFSLQKILEVTINHAASMWIR